MDFFVRFDLFYPGIVKHTNWQKEKVTAWLKEFYVPYVWTIHRTYTSLMIPTVLGEYLPWSKSP